MKHSESIAKLAPALVAAQADLKAIAKDATNPHFNSKFASLDAIIEAVRPILAKHGLCVVQSGAWADGPGHGVETRLIHASGEWLDNAVVIPLAKQDPQGAGAALRYGRRYGLSALLSIATEDDDDGNAASAPRKAQRAPQAQVPANPPEKKSELFFGMPRGTPLGEYNDSALIEIINWCKTKEQTPKMKQTIETARAILADRSLGQPTTDAERDAVAVSRLADKPDSLPF